MVFSSLNFLCLFLPICLGIYFLARGVKARNLVLLAFSLFFYAWGEPRWIVLMLVTVAIDYVAALIIAVYPRKWQAKAAMAGALVLTLGILGVFKYSGFFVSNLNGIFGSSFNVPKFGLPIGISFYTFQSVSYVVDVYRRKTRVQTSYATLLLYVSLFPQLIAGPILRYSDVAEQIEDRSVTLEGFTRGITRFTVGLGKKVLLANVAGQVVTTLIGGNLADASVLGAWSGIFCYMFQIYFDFAGYSDMAIGLGRMFGFEYMENFNYPYISKSITEFWRRWHISLSTFFRDYLYIPLGGSRCGKLKLVRNMLIVWSLTGLWHGASWNFVLWGLYYFVFLTIEKFFLGKYIQRMPKIVGHIYSLFIVLIGWVFFYFDDMGRLGHMFRLMFGLSGQPGANPTDTLLLSNHFLFFLFAILACLPLGRLVRRNMEAVAARSAAAEWIVGIVTIVFNAALLFMSIAALVGATYNPFLYFRF